MSRAHTTVAPPAPTHTTATLPARAHATATPPARALTLVSVSESELRDIDRLAKVVMEAVLAAFGPDDPTEFRRVKWHLMRHVAAFIREHGSLHHHSDQFSERTLAPARLAPTHAY